MDPLLTIKVNPPSGTIVLNRPQRRNALNRGLILELRQALSDLHQERKVRAVILIGQGDAFCAGMDLQEMQATSREPDAHAQWHRDAVLYQELIQALLLFPKPLIAAVNGPAVAGGAGLVLACDLTVAAENARIGLPEPKRGLVAGLVTPLLAFRVGGGRAAQLLLTGRLLEAEEARRCGLYHEVVAADLVWARAHALAAECAESAPEALQLTKKMLNETIGEHLQTMLTVGAAVSATARTTEAAAEGLAAFLEKRPPRWFGESPT